MYQIVPMDHEAYMRLYYKERNEIPPFDRVEEVHEDGLDVMEEKKDQEFLTPKIQS